MPFTFNPLSIPDIILIEPKIFPDERGFFFESFKSSDFQKFNLPAHFVQDNFSFSQKDVIRGLSRRASIVMPSLMDRPRQYGFR